MHHIQTLGNAIIDNLSRAVAGDQQKFNLITAALLAGGHVLLDDIPGNGKTTLAKALAASTAPSAESSLPPIFCQPM